MIDDYGRVLAEALSAAFAASSSGGKERLYGFLTSALMIDETNGLARRRKLTQQQRQRTGQNDAVSFVLTNTVVEYLVHRHVLHPDRGAHTLSYPEFLQILRERNGFFIDQAPPNMPVPNELLQRNRRMFERRLRDLGLLIGVNDAERMKKLRARYKAFQDCSILPEEVA
jgi:hypothetical protein